MEVVPGPAQGLLEEGSEIGGDSDKFHFGCAGFEIPVGLFSSLISTQALVTLGVYEREGCAWSPAQGF